MHECDLLTLNKSGYASEIEIKVSKSDLKADAHKSHLHRSNRIRHLYFAMPKEMECCEEFVPIQAGIVLVWHDADAYGDKPRYRCQLVRRPITNKCARKFTPEEVLDLARLGRCESGLSKGACWNWNTRLPCSKRQTIRFDPIGSKHLPTGVVDGVLWEEGYSLFLAYNASIFSRCSLSYFRVGLL